MSELEAIRDAVDKTTGGGRDWDRALELADAYVAAHPEEFTQLESLTLDQCVQAVGVFRAAGMADDWWRVETWIMHHFEPLAVGGPMQARVRRI